MSDPLKNWWALVGREVVGPYDPLDGWYMVHGGPGYRHRYQSETGIDPWRVAHTEVPDGGEVSTVFVGMDHQYGDGPPVLFETMVFPSNDCWRCCTYDEAEAQHARVVDAVLRGEVVADG